MQADVGNKGETIGAPLVLPPPPDGGWGWVICFASFMCNLVANKSFSRYQQIGLIFSSFQKKINLPFLISDGGIPYCFGVLLPPLIEYYDSNRGTVSWVGSLSTGVAFISGPIAGGLVNKFGCRFVCILGSVVSCIGMVHKHF